MEKKNRKRNMKRGKQKRKKKGKKGHKIAITQENTTNTMAKIGEMKSPKYGKEVPFHRSV